MIKRNIKRTSLLVATLALITACAQTSTTTSQKPTSSQKPTTPTTEPAHEKTLTSVSVATQPSKTEYELGTKLNLAGAQLKVTYSDGTTETVDIKDNMISAVDMNTSGSKTVTVTYENKTATFKITVKEKPVVVPVSVRFPKEADHVTIGGRLVLAPVISPAGAELVWHSSDEAVATVSNGVVSAKAYGNVVISVTQKGSDEVLATTKVFVLRQTAAPVNWADYEYNNEKKELTFKSGGTMPNLDQKVYNKIIIDEKVGEDQLTLSGLTATEEVIVKGGSATSIIFSGCVIGKLSIQKDSAGGEKPVRVEIGNGTSVKKIVMDSVKAILTVKDPVKHVEVKKDAKIQGTAPVAQVEVPEVTGGAAAPAIEVEGKVEKVVNEAKDTKITGTGTVDVVETKADMTLDVDTTIVPKADVTIKNEAKEGSAKLTEGNPVTYDSDVKYAEEGEGAAKPKALSADEAPKAGDSYLVYNANQLTAAFKKPDAAVNIILQAGITDYALSTTLKNSSYTLDLNDQQLTYKGSQDENWKNKYAIYIEEAGKLTVKDSSTKKGGVITFPNCAPWEGNEILGAIKPSNGGQFVLESGKLTVPSDVEGAAYGHYKMFSVWGNTKYSHDDEDKDNRADINSTVTLNGGTVEVPAGSNAYGVVLFGKGATFEINEGAIVELKNKGIALLGNGSKPGPTQDLSGTTMNIKGGAIIAEEVGIYHPQDGELNIEGGTIKACDALYMKTGTANVKGGTIESTAEKFVSYDEKNKGEEDEDGIDIPNDSGTNSVGAAVVLWGQDGYTGDIVFNVPANSTAQIKGGKGGAALYQLDKFRSIVGEQQETEYQTHFNVDNFGVFAGRVKTNKEEYYAASTNESLTSAFKSDVKEIRLVKDISDYGAYNRIDSEYILDLNGKTLAYANKIGKESDIGMAFCVVGGKLTIKDSAAAIPASQATGNIKFHDGYGEKENYKSGYGVAVFNSGHFTLESGTMSINTDKQFQFVAVNGNKEPTPDRDKYNSTAYIKGGKLNGTGDVFGVTMFGYQAKLEMTGGEINCPIGISGNGIQNAEKDLGGTLINVSGGKINASSVGIYHTQDGELNINGGEIVGNDGIFAKSGKVNITGGTIKSTATELVDYKDKPTTPEEKDTNGNSIPNGNGHNPVGAAIVLWSQNGYNGDIALDIEDATLEGPCGIYELHKFKTDATTTTIKVSSAFDKKYEAGFFHISEGVTKEVKPAPTEGGEGTGA